MRKLMILLVGVMSLPLFAQDTKVSDYVEGGKVVLEFVKLFKNNGETKSKSGNEDCKKLNRSDIFFENKRPGIIKVILSEKDNTGIRQEAIIQPGHKESIYNVLAKVYVCEIMDQSNMSIVRKGDIKLSPCENPTILIE